MVELPFRQYMDDHLEIFSNTIIPSKLPSTVTGSCFTRFHYYMATYQKDILSTGRFMLESGAMYVLERLLRKKLMTWRDYARNI